MSRWSDRAAARLLSGQRRSTWSYALWTAIVVAAGLAVAAVAVWVLVERRDEAPAQAAREPPARAVSRVSIGTGGEPIITLAADLQQRNGIETLALKPAPYQGQIRAYGTVLDPAGLTTLGNSNVSAKAQLDIAQAKLAASKAAFARAQSLYRNQQNVSQAEVQTAEAAFRTDQAGVAVAESQVRTLAATVVQEWGPVLARELAENGPLIARLIARQDFVVQVTLPPAVSLSLPPPATAMLELPAGARAPIHLISAAPRTDPKIQGFSFLYVASADSGVLPGMGVLAFIPDGNDIEATVVPSSAIVWWQGRAWAYLRSGPETFARREIPTAQPAPDGSGGYITRDLPANAEIVTRGAQALLSEEFRAQIDVAD